MLHEYGSKLRWMESSGGPLLLVPGEFLPFWRGIEPPPDGQHLEATNGPDEPATDYDSACDVQGYLGLLNIGAGYGLILGDEPLATAWQALEHGDVGGILIRWVYANSEADVISAVESIPEAAWLNDNIAFRVGHEPLYLLDAADRADTLEDGSYLTIHLPAGVYAIATTEYEPDSHTKLILHWLTLKAQDSQRAEEAASNEREQDITQTELAMPNYAKLHDMVEIRAAEKILACLAIIPFGLLLFPMMLIIGTNERVLGFFLLFTDCVFALTIMAIITKTFLRLRRRSMILTTLLCLNAFVLLQAVGLVLDATSGFLK